MRPGIPPINRNLQYNGVPTKPSPTLADVMEAIGQLQRNQSQLLQALDSVQSSVNLVMLNQTTALFVTMGMLGELSPNATVHNAVMNASLGDLFEPSPNSPIYPN
jgi:hypothetical protein